MRRSAAILGLGLVTCAGAAFTQELVNGQGFGWSTGGSREAVPGDSLSILFVADRLLPQFGINLGLEEVTGSMTAIVKSTQHFDGVAVYQCADGKLWIGHDGARDHDFGTNPPNLTAPSSFLDGTACLTARLTDLQFYFDWPHSVGAFLATVGPLTGDCADDVPLSCTVAPPNVYGELALPPILAPSGYDFVSTVTLQRDVEPALDYLPCFEMMDAEFSVASPECGVPGTLVRDFHIRGVFTENRSSPPFDPGSTSIGVQFAPFRNGPSLPAGSFVEQPFAAQRTWVSTGAGESTVLSEVIFVLEGDRQWAFELRGRGVPRTELLPTPGELYVAFLFACSIGRSGVFLQSDCNRLWYRAAGPRPCGGPATPTPTDTATDPRRRRGWQLDLAQPNPFTVRATIRVHAADPRAVQLAIYDARGTLVRSLHHGRMAPGENGFAWDGRDRLGQPVPAGVYLCRLRTPESTAAQKLILVK